MFHQTCVCVKRNHLLNCLIMKTEFYVVMDTITLRVTVKENHANITYVEVIL